MAQLAVYPWFDRLILKAILSSCCTHCHHDPPSLCKGSWPNCKHIANPAGLLQTLVDTGLQFTRAFSVSLIDTAVLRKHDLFMRNDKNKDSIGFQNEPCKRHTVYFTLPDWNPGKSFNRKVSSMECRVLATFVTIPRICQNHPSPATGAAHRWCRTPVQTWFSPRRAWVD